MLLKSWSARFRKLLSYHTFWLTFGTAIVSTAIVLGVVSFSISHRYEFMLTRQMEKTHNHISNRMAKEIGLFFENISSQLKLVSNIIAVSNISPDEMRAILNEVALHSPHFLEINYADLSGKEIATSNTAPPGRDFSVSPALKNAIEGKKWISGVFFDERRLPNIFISEPIQILDSPKGFLLTKVSLKKLWWWLDELNNAKGTKMSVIETRKGLVVADNLRSNLMKIHPLWTGNRRSGVIEISGENRFVSYHHIPGVEMEIVTETTMQTFFDKIYEMRIWLVLFGSFALAFMMLIALWSAEVVSRPVRYLVSRMNSYIDDENVRIKRELPTEYRNIADAFNNMADSIESHQKEMLKKESMVTIGRTLSGVSHEVRHGMTRILNLLHDTVEFDREALEKAKMAISDMNDKMNNLLEFSRAGQLDLQETHVKDILFGAKELIRYRHDAGDCKILLENTADSLLVVVDEPKLSIALSNLIRNSIEAGGTIIRLSSCLSNGVLDFIILDNGAGIPIDIQEKILEPFFTSKKKGFGIGLSIVEMVAKAHGGSMALCRSDANGTEFKISIPIAS